MDEPSSPASHPDSPPNIVPPARRVFASAANQGTLSGNHSHDGGDVPAVEIEEVKGRHSGDSYRYCSEHCSTFATGG